MAPRRLQICSFRLDASYRRHPGLSVSVEPSHRTRCVMRSGRGSLARRCVMKKLELTIVPLLVMLSLSPAAGQSSGTGGSAAPAPAALSLPATSLAHPDVLGIKVGVSTVEDVRSILSGTAL